MYNENEALQETMQDDMESAKNEDSLEENFWHCLPKAPINVFGTKIEMILTAVSIGKSVPLEMVICAFLSLGSCCLGRSRGVIYNNQWREYANLFFLLIAETGLGKSHVFSYFFDEVRQADELLTRKWKEEWNKYQDELDTWKKSKTAERDDRPLPPLKLTNLINDATMEAVVERLEHNPRGLFWEIDEFSGFFQRLDRYNKNGMGEGKSKLLTMWDSGKIAVSRKNNEGVANEIYIPKATVGMFGAIQPDLLQSTFTADDVKQGVPQRFVFVRAQQFKIPKLPYPKIDSWVSDDVKRIVNRLLSLNMSTNDIGSPEAEFLTLSESASRYFEEFVNTMNTKTAHSEMAGYAFKMARITLRLALILHFLEWAISGDIDYSRKIDVDIMESATELARYFLIHAEKVHMLLPTYKNKEGKKDVTIAERIISGVILQNIEKIKEYADITSVKCYIVPTKEIDKFFEKTKLKKAVIYKTLQMMGSVRKRTNVQRCFSFNEEFIKKCYMMNMLMKDILSDDVE